MKSLIKINKTIQKVTKKIVVFTLQCCFLMINLFSCTVKVNFMNLLQKTSGKGHKDH